MIATVQEIHSSAVVSEDGKYRYHLCRWWGDGPRVLFVMLNPSTADERVNDATISKCVGYARRWGYDGIDVANLYAFRETKPKLLWTARSLAIDIVGRSNDTFLTVLARQAWFAGAPLVGAWGANAEVGRVMAVMRLPHFDRMQHLGQTKGGMPRHPLYLPNEAEPQPFRWVA